ncbi:MAG: hypothetical protein JWP97_942 [Labilithrix sp.]|nr:hypothetical protein [Labilithrix sp.]
MNVHISTHASATMPRTEQTRQAIPVQNVMTPQPVTIGRGESLATAKEMMRVHACHHLPVLEHGELVGVISRRDLELFESIAGVERLSAPLDRTMAPEVYAVAPDAPLSDVARHMATHRRGCAVVLERKRVIGIFTATDALNVLAAHF